MTTLPPLLGPADEVGALPAGLAERLRADLSAATAAESRARARLLEAVSLDVSSWGYLDPRDLGIGDAPNFGPAPGLPGLGLQFMDRRGRGEFLPLHLSEPQLRWYRKQCRAVVLASEVALNVLGQHQSYAVGRGLKAEAQAKDGCPGWLLRDVQGVLDAFWGRNRMDERVADALARVNTDGEALLRLFPRGGGLLDVRTVEAEHCHDPVLAGGAAEAGWNDSYGVRTAAGDVEWPEGYWIDEGLPEGQGPRMRLVPAAGVCHWRHPETPLAVKRGWSPFWCVLTTLKAAEDLLTATVTLAKVRAKIAAVQKLTGSSMAAAQALAANQASYTATDPASGEAVNIEQLRYGSILRMPATSELDFPASAVGAADHVAVMGMVLRQVAARFGMPEYLLSSDASNGSYASTMVAESPFVKRMECWQEQVSRWLAGDPHPGPFQGLLWRQVDHASACGLLPDGVLKWVTIQVEGPSLTVRDTAKEAQTDNIQHQDRVKSIKTIRMEQGLDHDEEEKNFQEEDAAAAKRDAQKGTQPGELPVKAPGVPQAGGKMTEAGDFDEDKVHRADDGKFGSGGGSAGGTGEGGKEKKAGNARAAASTNPLHLNETVETVARKHQSGLMRLMRSLHQGGYAGDPEGYAEDVALHTARAHRANATAHAGFEAAAREKLGAAYGAAALASPEGEAIFAAVRRSQTAADMHIDQMAGVAEAQVPGRPVGKDDRAIMDHRAGEMQQAALGGFHAAFDAIDAFKAAHRSGRATEAGDWSEGKHPRDHGQFAEKPGAGGGTAAKGPPAPRQPSGAKGGTGQADKFGKTKGAEVVFSGPADAKAAPGVVRKLLGKGVTVDDLPSLVGAPDGARVTVRAVAGTWAKVEVSVDHDNFKQPAVRVFGRNAAGEAYCENKIIDVKRPPAPPGLGTAVFGRQVEQLRAAGVSYIKCHAARYDGDGESYFNGYYTWPLMGYDQALDDMDETDSHVRDMVRAAFPQAETVADVFASEGGPEWWKEHGTDLFSAVFDLREGSKSVSRFEGYVEARAARQGQAREALAPEPRRATAGNAEEMDLSPEEEAAALGAWAAGTGGEDGGAEEGAEEGAAGTGPLKESEDAAGHEHGARDGKFVATGGGAGASAAEEGGSTPKSAPARPAHEQAARDHAERQQARDSKRAAIERQRAALAAVDVPSYTPATADPAAEWSAVSGKVMDAARAAGLGGGQLAAVKERHDARITRAAEKLGKATAALAEIEQARAKLGDEPPEPDAPDRSALDALEAADGWDEDAPEYQSALAGHEKAEAAFDQAHDAWEKAHDRWADRSERLDDKDQAAQEKHDDAETALHDAFGDAAEALGEAAAAARDDAADGLAGQEEAVDAEEEADPEPEEDEAGDEE